MSCKVGCDCACPDECIATRANETDQTKKQDAGKPQLGLIPRWAMIDLAAALEVGRTKYGAHSWRANPMEFSRVIDAMRRHVAAYSDGEDTDPQDGQPHLGAIMACCAFLSTYTREHPELDDRYKPERRVAAIVGAFCPADGFPCDSPYCGLNGCYKNGEPKNAVNL